MVMAYGNLRGSEPEPCVDLGSSCTPTANRCCQGPGLMTCRLRPSTVAGGVGMAYQCGEEFPQQKLPDPSCTPEGRGGLENCARVSVETYNSKTSRSGVHFRLQLLPSGPQQLAHDLPA